MILLLLIGLLGVFVIILLKSKIIVMINSNNKLIHILKNTIWFQSHWLSGLFLFFINAVLFFSTLLILHVLTFFFIPYVHFFIMFFAVTISLFVWIITNKAWLGTNGNRLIRAAVGSSFYMLLSLILFYLLVTVKPLFPGDDTFMRELGLTMGLVVTTVAFISCFLLTGFSIRHKGKIG